MRSRWVSTSSSRPGSPTNDPTSPLSSLVTSRSRNAELAELLANGAQLRGQRRRAIRPLRLRGRRAQRRPVTVLGSERLERGGRALDELGDAAQACSLAPQRLVVAWLEPLGVANEQRELREPSCSPPASRSSASSRRLAAVSSRQAVGLPTRRVACCLTEEPIERVELKRGSREAPLLELPGHGDQPLGRSCQIFARNCPAPTRRRACGRRRRPGERARATPRQSGRSSASAARSSSSQNPTGTSNSAST